MENYSIRSIWVSPSVNIHLVALPALSPAVCRLPETHLDSAPQSFYTAAAPSSRLPGHACAQVFTRNQIRSVAFSFFEFLPSLPHDKAAGGPARGCVRGASEREGQQAVSEWWAGRDGAELVTEHRAARCGTSSATLCQCGSTLVVKLHAAHALACFRSHRSSELHVRVAASILCPAA